MPGSREGLCKGPGGQAHRTLGDQRGEEGEGGGTRPEAYEEM